jgi:hypothetical protein
VFEFVAVQNRENLFGQRIAVLRPADDDAAKSQRGTAEAFDQRQRLGVIGKFADREPASREQPVHRAPARCRRFHEQDAVHGASP